MSHQEADIVDYIIAEHKKAATLLIKAKQSADAKLVRQAVECLSKHSFVEESLLYPILQDILGDKDPAFKSLHDHSEVRIDHFSNFGPPDSV
jgi:hemerythrin superfamily protein